MDQLRVQDWIRTWLTTVANQLNIQSVFKLNNSQEWEESSSEALKLPGPHTPTHTRRDWIFQFPKSSLCFACTDPLHVWVSSPPVNVFFQQLILSEGPGISLLLPVMLWIFPVFLLQAEKMNLIKTPKLDRIKISRLYQNHMPKQRDYQLYQKARARNNMKGCLWSKDVAKLVECFLGMN